MKTGFVKLSGAYTKYYSQIEYVAVGEIIVLFKGRVFSNSVSQRNKWFGMRINKLCD
jgi:hypothetical protein